MKKPKVFILICILCSACSSADLEVMDMTKTYYPPDVIMEKAKSFSQRGLYTDAYQATSIAIRRYEQETNQEGIRKANALLCHIYQQKRPYRLNPYYNLESAMIACKKAGIKMNQE